ncbi:protein of unknown function [Taphrina deformans PYCC 5710]|uniref:50S ribosomal protein L17 n=1 Tax=Taphrina deformans (strain PYCC 5710 / ATCC 11124 / CBS 356.35 / IMI 108563 / JCM 9778 / NBRC 8474) TaxID=1097556 RepID=R4XK02_TAPDE|nr:protein of unknown function [Taphrina deformans PYCC 5710]|eukprot:CCG84783.1 protein of unknown function [Taphrina deformans PYCC 5710]
MPTKRNYRGLGRSSAHRQAMLRNLVTSLIQHESITTTWHKAKEAQSIAEKIISHGKRGTSTSMVAVRKILFEPTRTVNKVFSELAGRYRDRPGGYTRVLRVPDRKGDKAETAVLELVDGPKDVRFALTAKTIARNRVLDSPMTDLTLRNLAKVTKYRRDGENQLEILVSKEARAMNKGLAKGARGNAAVAHGASAS